MNKSLPLRRSRIAASHRWAATVLLTIALIVLTSGFQRAATAQASRLSTFASAAKAGSLEEVTLPAKSDWIDHGTVLSAGPDGAWDQVLVGSVTPSTVVKVGSTLHFYYVGADGYRADEGPAHRSLGLATAPASNPTDLTKHPSNPLITHHIWKEGINETHESGVFSAGGLIDTNGDVVVYFGGMEENESGSVDGDVVFEYASDGVRFGGRTDVLRAHDSGTFGDDETFPFGAILIDGTYYVYYTAKGGVTNWTMALTQSSTRNSGFDGGQKVSGPSKGDFKGGGDPVRLSDTEILIPVKTGWGGGATIDWYTAETSDPASLTLADSYSWPEVNISPSTSTGTPTSGSSTTGTTPALT